MFAAIFIAGLCLAVPSSARQKQKTNMSSNCILNEKRPNPANPYTFYNCRADGPVLMKCPKGFIFDAFMMDCVRQVIHQPTNNVSVVKLPSAPTGGKPPPPPNESSAPNPTGGLSSSITEYSALVSTGGSPSPTTNLSALAPTGGLTSSLTEYSALAPTGGLSSPQTQLSAPSPNGWSSSRPSGWSSSPDSTGLLSSSDSTGLLSSSDSTGLSSSSLSTGWSPSLSTGWSPPPPTGWSAPTTPAPTTVPAPVECPAEEGEFPAYLPNLEDCGSFYICSNGTPYLLDCPVFLLWNVHLLTCDYPWNVNCALSEKNTLKHTKRQA